MVGNKNGWISSYELQFGMAPTQNDRGIITSAVSNFCKSFGRETKVPSPTPVTGMSNILANESHTRKRRKLKTIKSIKSMRTDRFKEHLTTEHPLKWSAYQELDDEGKKSFFTQPVLNTFLQLIHSLSKTKLLSSLHSCCVMTFEKVISGGSSLLSLK